MRRVKKRRMTTLAMADMPRGIPVSGFRKGLGMGEEREGDVEAIGGTFCKGLDRISATRGFLGREDGRGDEGGGLLFFSSMRTVPEIFGSVRET